MQEFWQNVEGIIQPFGEHDSRVFYQSKPLTGSAFISITDRVNIEDPARASIDFEGESRQGIDAQTITGVDLPKKIGFILV